jgi:hypothetical protein
MIHTPRFKGSHCELSVLVHTRTRNSRAILVLLHFYSAIISPIYPTRPAGESLLIKRTELSRGEVDAIPD